MPTRLDPSRTSLIRKAFESEMRKRFHALRKAVDQLIVDEDALGLEEGHPFTVNTRGAEGALTPEIYNALGRIAQVAVNAERQVWRFQTDDDKLKSFKRWLKLRIEQEILSTDAQGKPWTAKFIESAYKKGNLRAYLDSIGKEARQKSPDFFEGSRQTFLRTAFGQPERASKVKLLATRSFEELDGITADMAAKMNRILADGMVQGQNPRVIARTMAKQVDEISKKRALVIARTEVIHAHAEGQLDSFEDLGVEEVGVYAEWSTAGDDKVCPLCEKLEGTIFKIKEARGLIPRHPNCRCSFIPATDVTEKTRRKSMLKKVAKSLKEEGSRSRWVGKLLRGT